MSELHYHQATFAMLGQRPVRSDDSLAAVERWEQKHEVTLPGAIREWFEIEGATELWERHSDGDEPVPLKDLSFETVVRARLPEEDDAKKMLRSFAEECDGEIIEVLDKPGWLLLMTESQGCCQWYVQVDGSDDPAVFNDGDLSDIDRWHVVSGRFSAFLFDWIGDFRYNPYAIKPKVKGLIARHRLPTEEELSYLRAELSEGPPKASEDAAFHYRFFSSRAIVKIGAWQEDRDEVEAIPQWEIRAANLEALEEIARLLWPLGSLAENLRPAEIGSASVKKVLRRLGQPKKRPTTALDFYELAEERRRRRQPQEVIDLFNRAIELEPTMIRAHKRRMFCHEELQDYEAIVADYAQMLELRKEPFWYWERSEHLCSLQRYEEAAADICAAIELDPDMGDYADHAGSLKQADRSDLFHRVMEHWRDHPPQDRWDYREKVEEYFRGRGE